MRAWLTMWVGATLFSLLSCAGPRPAGNEPVSTESVAEQHPAWLTVATIPGVCDELLKRESFARLMEAMSQVPTSPAAWPGYRIRDQSVVFEWVGTPQSCVAHWARGEVVALAAVEQPLELMLPFYGFFSSNDELRAGNPVAKMFFAAALPPAIRASLDAHDAQTAGIFVINLDRVMPTEELAAMAREQESALNHFILAAHESFHAHVMFPWWFEQPRRWPWPRWDVQPDRNALVERCYRRDDVADLLLREHTRLLDALRAVLAEDVDAFATAVADFKAARTERYELLDGVSVPPSMGQEPMSCPQAEAIMELEEGGADFVALTEVVAAGLLQRSELAAHVKGPDHAEPYYGLGSAQLLIARELDAARLTTALEAMSNSQDWTHGIYAVFSSFTSSSDAP